MSCDLLFIIFLIAFLQFYSWAQKTKITCSIKCIEHSLNNCHKRQDNHKFLWDIIVKLKNKALYNVQCINLLVYIDSTHLHKKYCSIILNYSALWHLFVFQLAPIYVRLAENSVECAARQRIGGKSCLGTEKRSFSRGQPKGRCKTLI